MRRGVVFLAWSAAVLAVGVLVLTVAVVGGLRSSYGGELLRARLVERVNRVISGRLAIASLSYDVDRVVLSDVALSAPDGTPVAHIDRIDLRVALLPLLRRHLEVRRLELTRPSLWLRSGPDGVNLLAALAPRRPSWRVSPTLAGHTAAQPRRVEMKRASSSLGPFKVLDVQGLRAVEGAFEWRGSEGRRVAVEDLRLGGHVRWDVGVRALAGAVSIEARGREPLDGALVCDADVLWEGDRGSASIDVDTSGGRVWGAAALEPTRRGPGLRFEAHGRDLDLSAWLRQAPRSELAFDAGAMIAGHDLSDLEGEIDLTLPRSRIGASVAGPVRLRAAADDGVIMLRELYAALPGVRVEAAGRIGRDEVRARADLSVRSLRQTLRLLLGDAARRLPRLEIRGESSLSLSGPRRGPSLRATASLGRIRWNGVGAEGVTTILEVPSLATPQVARASIRARAIEVGAERLRGFKARFEARQRQVAGQLEVAGPEPVSARIAGAWRPDWTALEVSSLSVLMKDAHWISSRPFAVALGSKRSSRVGPVLLSSGQQKLALSYTRVGPAIDATVRAQSLRLEALPSVVLPPQLRGRGLLDAQIEVTGRTSKPDIRVDATLSTRAIGPLHGVGIQLRGRMLDGRGAGSITLDSDEAVLEASFDLPMRWPWPAAASIDLRTNVHRVDLARLAAAVGRAPLLLEGRISGRVTLGGSAGVPTVSAALAGTGLALRGQPLGDVSVVAHGGQGVPLTMRLSSIVLDRPGWIEIEIDRGLGELLASRGRDLLDVPMSLHAALDHLPLAEVAALAGSPLPLGGTVSLDARLEGRAVAPSGTLALDVHAGAISGVPPTDGRIELTLAEQIRAQLLLARGGRPLLQARAILDLPASRLTDLAAVRRAPLSLEAVAGPLHVRRSRPVLRRGIPTAQVLEGSVQATLRVTGTPADPRASLAVTAERFRLDGAEVGRARLDASYAAGRVSGTLETVPSAPLGGRLRLTADAAVDLSVAGLRQGLRLSSVPFNARLDAQRFDVAWLSGMVADVRDASGTVDAQITVQRDSSTEPNATGWLRWSDGSVLIEGLGAYRAITVDMTFDRRRLTLRRLLASAGTGRATVSGHAVFAAAGLVELEMLADLDRFPLYVEGQQLAMLSLRSSVSATVTEQQARFDRVDIPEAHVELVSTQRRSVQDLAPAPDIVLMRKGQPANAEEALKLRRLEARSPGERNEIGHILARDRVQLSAQLSAPRNVWIRGDEVDVEIGLTPGFRLERDGELRAFGDVQILRGSVVLFGRRLEIQKSSKLQFGGPVATPTFDVVAVYEVKAQNIVITLTLRGQGAGLSLSVSSSPPYSESEIYSLLIPGRLGFRGGPALKPTTSTAAGQAASIAGAFITSRLQRALRSSLPLDVLTIQSGGAGVAGSRLEAGKYVTRNLYLGYVGRIGSDPLLRYQNRNAVHLEYQLTKQWSFEAEYGDAGAGGLDLVWSRRF